MQQFVNHSLIVRRNQAIDYQNRLQRWTVNSLYRYRYTIRVIRPIGPLASRAQASVRVCTLQTYCDGACWESPAGFFNALFLCNHTPHAQHTCHTLSVPHTHTLSNHTVSQYVTCTCTYTYNSSHAKTT